jgi:hypothetical protein
MKSMSHEMQITGTTSAMKMSRKKWIVITAGAILLFAGWLLFRPELLFVDKSVSESLPLTSAAGAVPSSGPMLLTRGVFHGVAHETKGEASVFQLADGKRVVRLTNFETSNGPDVHVFLVAAADATDSDMVKQAGYVDLGSLKGNVGDQNYNVPADVDLSKYRAVTIWCNRFGVNFGTAPLKEGDSASRAREPVSLVAGSFHDGAHATKGTATIHRLADGKRILRLTDFETSNGPDVRVYLVAANDATDSETVKSAGHIELGKLKGNIGDQNYDVPADVDLDKYRAVTIWCARFGVNFGTAPLN